MMRNITLWEAVYEFISRPSFSEELQAFHIDPGRQLASEADDDDNNGPDPAATTSASSPLALLLHRLQLLLSTERELERAVLEGSEEEVYRHQLTSQLLAWEQKNSVLLQHPLFGGRREEHGEKEKELWMQVAAGTFSTADTSPSVESKAVADRSSSSTPKGDGGSAAVRAAHADAVIQRYAALMGDDLEEEGGEEEEEESEGSDGEGGDDDDHPRRHRRAYYVKEVCERQASRYLNLLHDVVTAFQAVQQSSPRVKLSAFHAWLAAADREVATRMLVQEEEVVVIDHTAAAAAAEHSESQQQDHSLSLLTHLLPYLTAVGHENAAFYQYQLQSSSSSSDDSSEEEQQQPSADIIQDEPPCQQALHNAVVFTYWALACLTAERIPDDDDDDVEKGEVDGEEGSSMRFSRQVAQPLGLPALVLLTDVKYRYHDPCYSPSSISGDNAVVPGAYHEGRLLAVLYDRTHQRVLAALLPHQPSTSYLSPASSLVAQRLEMVRFVSALRAAFALRSKSATHPHKGQQEEKKHVEESSSGSADDNGEVTVGLRCTGRVQRVYFAPPRGEDENEEDLSQESTYFCSCLPSIHTDEVVEVPLCAWRGAIASPHRFFRAAQSRGSELPLSSSSCVDHEVRFLTTSVAPLPSQQGGAELSRLDLTALCAWYHLRFSSQQQHGNAMLERLELLRREGCRRMGVSEAWLEELLHHPPPSSPLSPPTYQQQQPREANDDDDDVVLSPLTIAAELLAQSLQRRFLEVPPLLEKARYRVKERERDSSTWF